MNSIQENYLDVCPGQTSKFAAAFRKMLYFSLKLKVTINAEKRALVDLFGLFGRLREEVCWRLTVYFLLGAEVVCGQTLSELIDLLGLPDTLDSLVATARGWMCN